MRRDADPVEGPDARVKPLAIAHSPRRYEASCYVYSALGLRIYRATGWRVEILQDDEEES